MIITVNIFDDHKCANFNKSRFGDNNHNTNDH